MEASKEVRQHIQKLVDYMYEEEKTHFEKSSKESQAVHIFGNVKKVKEWLEG